MNELDLKEYEIKYTLDQVEYTENVIAVSNIVACNYIKQFIDADCIITDCKQVA